MKPLRKVRSAVPFISMSGGRRWRLHLECDHTVARPKQQDAVRCEYCGNEGEQQP
jgi:hypothetical protein